MKIGILGLGWDLGIPLALTLRDYGNHAVIAHGNWDEMTRQLKIDGPTMQPEREVRSMLEAWQLPVTDRQQLFAEYCDLVFICHPVALTGCLGWLDHYRSKGIPLPTVVSYPSPNPAGLVAWNRAHRRLDIGYSPLQVDRTNAIGRLTNPQGPIVVWGSRLVHSTVELAWRRVVNTVPVRHRPSDSRALLLEGPVVGSPRSTEPSEAPPGDVDTPGPSESRREGT